MFSALPVEDYINQMEKNFRKKRSLIESELKKIKSSPIQEGIYSIENYYQFYEHALKMIKNADEIVAVDCTPLPLEVLEKELHHVAMKGIKIFVKAYTDISIPGCEMIYSEEMSVPVQKLPIQFINLIVPGKEQLAAFLDKENKTIFQAVLCKSQFLTLSAYNGFMAEFFVTKVLNLAFKDQGAEAILKEWEKIDPYKPGKISAIRDFIQSYL